MFFPIAKLGALVLMPSNFLVLLLAAGIVLAATRRFRTSGRRLALGAGAVLCAASLLPVGDWLLEPLEGRFADYRPEKLAVSGVILLGGGVSFGQDGRPRPNDAADRIFLAADLARAHPGARVVVTGGPLRPDGRSEADATGRFLAELGVSPPRMIIERRSRDTYENARFVGGLVRPKPEERWILVTSASHMPRAFAVFRKAGFNVVAAPADRRASGTFQRTWSASGNLRNVDVAVKEYLGLIAYRARGRTGKLLP